LTESIIENHVLEETQFQSAKIESEKKDEEEVPLPSWQAIWFNEYFS